MLSQQAQGLRAAVDAGHVVMDPDSSTRLADFYEGKADDLQQETRRTNELIAWNSYGDCHIGRAMEKKMADKIEAPGTGAIAILRRMEQTLREMAAAVRDSARETRNTDEENARELGRNI